VLAGPGAAVVRDARAQKRSASNVGRESDVRPRARAFDCHSPLVKTVMPAGDATGRIVMAVGKSGEAPTATS